MKLGKECFLSELNVDGEPAAPLRRAEQALARLEQPLKQV
jgi:hypothetical protein